MGVFDKHPAFLLVFCVFKQTKYGCDIMSCNISKTIPLDTINYHSYGCNTVSPDYGGRGVTYWAHPSGVSYTLAPNQSRTITFTCTKPLCYEGKDWCNVHFEATPKGATGSWSDTELKFSVNGAYTQNMYLSGVPDHGMWQTYDLANIPNEVYHDTGINTIVLTNPNNSGTIEVSGFKIQRVYRMKHYNYTTASTPSCSPAVNTGSNGNLDHLREDYPCHLTTCGKRSVTTTRDAVAGSIIPAGGCAEWVFNWSPNIPGQQNFTSVNYVAQDVTLFNFNQMSATIGSTFEQDVKLSAYLNGSLITTFYLSRFQNKPAFPSYDLTKSLSYNDTSANTVRLVNNSNVSVKFEDAYGINIYRTYQTATICPPCGSCNTSCQTGCETSCQSCYTNQSCNNCINCYLCYAWYLSCQAGCEFACLDCQAGCEIECQGCEGCQGCVSCQTCQGCEECQVCVNCQGSELCPNPQYICSWCETCQPYQTPEATPSDKDTKPASQRKPKTETVN